MALKDLWSRMIEWFKDQRAVRAEEHYEPAVDDEGLLSHEGEGQQQDDTEHEASENENVMVEQVPAEKKPGAMEKLQAGFEQLITQLEGINDNLNNQVEQQKELIEHMNKMPKLMETFPESVENQRNLIEKMLEEVKATSLKNEQFVDAVSNIPNETAKQTDALVEINHQLSAAADTDVQMSETFNKFTETLGDLNNSAKSQNDTIKQMNKTFATSDRYFKYIISKQNKRFLWLFFSCVSVCVVVILILVGIILYLRG